IGPALFEDVQEIRRAVCSSRGDQRYGYALCNGLRERQVETAARAVAIHGSKQNLAGAAFRALDGPIHRIATGGLPPASYERLPTFTNSFRVDRQYDGLRAKLSGQFGEKLRTPQRGR